MYNLIKCKIIYCQMARFFLFQIKRDCGLDYIFGVNPSLTVVIIEILFSKFLSFVSMK